MDDMQNFKVCGHPPCVDRMPANSEFLALPQSKFTRSPEGFGPLLEVMSRQDNYS
jgi:hypothetical protein